MTVEKKRPSSSGFRDVVFGPQILPENRVATHIRNQTGIRHLHRRSPVVARPDTPVALTVTTSGEIPFDAVVCRYRTGTLEPVELPFTTDRVDWDDMRWDYVRYWEAVLPGFPDGSIVRYTITARVTGTDRWVFADTQIDTKYQSADEADNATVFAFSVDGYTVPDWARSARVYHIFVDRFSPGAGKGWSGETDLRAYHGGTLGGVIDHLDYIHSLGFNAIWLSPIFASPSHHGYDATDLFQVEPRLGTNEDLEALLRLAHDLGIRIILDFVPNHWSDEHPTFVHAVEIPNSPFRDWYHWDEWPHSYRSFFDVPTMPKINLSAGSPARGHMLDAARYWLQKGVDGYRVDHAEGPPPDFWPDFRRVCLETRGDAWLFGEVGRPPNVVRTYAGELHGNLDFNLARALRHTFALGNWPLSAFEAFLQNHLEYFPDDDVSPAFLDNHDMNRFLFIAGGDERRLKLAALVLYTLPGPPVVYYGTERALSQARSNDDGVGLDEARQPVDWRDETGAELQAYFTRLNALRSRYPPAQDANRQVVVIDDERGLYAYRWRTEGGGYLVVLNAGETEANISIPEFGGDDPVDLLNGQPVQARDGRLDITLAAQTGAWIAAF
ncbi:MAG TPA: alpha-amylase family glycosyl hydrolase [Anaerolineales bacterium]|nr:alpha-amylase family glycosyl hydrolase [Anaerolineales bacterium]